MHPRISRTLFILVCPLCRGARVHNIKMLATDAVPAALEAGDGMQHCNTSTVPIRSRSAWCERGGNLDEHISFEQIRSGQGLCLDGRCYDAGSLRVWLQTNERLPHNRAPFSVDDLDELLGVNHTGRAQPMTTIATLSPVGSAWRVAVSQRFVGAGSHEGFVQVWDAVTLEEKHRFQSQQGPVVALEFNPVGDRLLVGYRWQGVKLWDIVTGDSLLFFTRAQHGGCLVTTAAWSPDGTQVLTGSTDGDARLWQATRGELVRRFRDGREVTSVAFRPPLGDEIAVGYAGFGGGILKLWNVQTGVERLSFHAHDLQVDTVAFASDGQRLVTTSLQSNARIWDADTGVLLQVIGGRENHMRPEVRAVFSPDGSKLLTCSLDYNAPWSGRARARLWDPWNGSELKRLDVVNLDIRGSQACRSAAFSPDGERAFLSIGGQLHWVHV